MTHGRFALGVKRQKLFRHVVDDLRTRVCAIPRWSCPAGPESISRPQRLILLNQIETRERNVEPGIVA